MSTNQNPSEEIRQNFIKQIIDEDLKNQKNSNNVFTRFPPEPNGYLHIGHAKSICLNFGIAKEYLAKGFKAQCNLRFDDTNPAKEEQEYIDSIIEDVRWLGFDIGNGPLYASHYFDQMYNYALELIKMGKAYICELTPDQTREFRGTLKSPGKNSPFRDRSVEENLALFEKMRSGVIEEGKMVLRAKIDMSSPFIVMRDPILYRVIKKSHPVTKDKWCIYPMYDYAHCLEDMIEGITHSLCTLEFQDNRRFYDWVLDTLKTPCHPQQIEFARLQLEYTVVSKRYLKQLVDEKIVNGWDDPRMPTLKGIRRRGVRPEAIHKFAEQIGVTKKDSTITIDTLETIIRDDLGPVCPRVFGVVNPLKVTITNWDKGTQNIEAAYHPQDEAFGKRMVPMTKEIYIEQEDFKEDADKKFFRLKPEGYVRLKYAYVLKCDEVIKDENGAVIELKCTYFPETFAGNTPEGFPKVKGIINWVSATESIEIENREYDRLFTVENPMSDKDKFKDFINPNSLIIKKSFVEKALHVVKTWERYQFERQGYYIVDADSTKDKLVFNRIISLKDNWQK